MQRVIHKNILINLEEGWWNFEVKTDPPRLNLAQNSAFRIPHSEFDLYSCYTFCHMPPLFRSAANANQQTASRRILLIVALCLFIVALALVIIQSIPGSNLKIKTYADGYAEGFNKARDMAKAQSPMLTETRNISGMVTAKNGDSITVEDPNLFVDERVDGVGSTRTVNIDTNTRIIRRTRLSEEEFQKKIATFQAASQGLDLRSNAAPPAPPSPFAETSATLNDIMVGDHVLVTPNAEGLDITTTETFTASIITISEK